ncbi:hypothetical protein ABZP36_031317 [Zizania latifolia]
MSCFGMASTGMPLSPSPSRRRGVGTWRWWRRCTGLAAAIHSKIRRRAVRWGVQGGRGRGRRRSSSSLRSGWCHHRSSAPVYVDELYSRPKTHHVAVHEAPPPQQQQPSTKLAARAGTANHASAAAANAGASGKARAGTSNNAAAAATNAGASNKATAGAAAATNAGACGKARGGAVNKATAAATNAGARSVMMIPRRGAAAGMGEVDLRAELFISKFREEMRLQNQQSAEEFHAMLARGL